MSILHHLTFPELCASNEIDNFGFVSNLLFCEKTIIRYSRVPTLLSNDGQMTSKSTSPSSIQTELNGGKMANFLDCLFTLFYINKFRRSSLGFHFHSNILYVPICETFLCAPSNQSPASSAQKLFFFLSFSSSIWRKIHHSFFLVILL